MKGFVGEGFSMLIACLALVSVVGVVLALFLAPSASTGLPEAIGYFTGVFTRG